ncbi:hypothetical protein D9757_002008 [Collybiopsis confluens]|uniref:Pali-domain-containing protein n=1 Tax=Collybiopsis confluens TaxID=2823264 RepID=A0A8H5MES8_9AGAR|nr:hypothetical protein D9757_002008 [Collybiopsis confluens]
MLAAIITPALSFVAFVLLLFATLSVPIIKSIFLFTLAANISSQLESASATVRFGVWGYCTSSVDVAGLFSDNITPAKCSPVHLGYTFDATIAHFLQVPLNLDSNELVRVVSKTTTAALVLHPIACALTFLTMLISLFMFRRGSNRPARLPSLLTLIIGTLAALLTTIVFLIDVILVAVIRDHVKEDTDGDVSLNWGNAVWIALGATIALWLAMVATCGRLCACGSQKRFVLLSHTLHPSEA